MAICVTARIFLFSFVLAGKFYNMVCVYMHTGKVSALNSIHNSGLKEKGEQGGQLPLTAPPLLDMIEE